MRVFSRVLAAVAVAILVLAAQAATAQALRPITIAVSSPSLGASAARVANEIGLFGKHGLAPKFSVMDNSSDALAALFSGSVEFAVAGTPELIVAHARGQTQLVAIATSSGPLMATLVLSKAVADSKAAAAGTPADRLKALDGIVIASPSAASIGSTTLRRATQSVGATVRLTYMSQPAMFAAFEKGAIQGYFSSAPFWVPPVLNGTGVVWISGPQGDIPTDVAPAVTAQMQTLRPYAEKNRDIVQRVAAVLDDYGKALRERPAEVKAAVRRLYPSLDAATVDLLFETELRPWEPGQVTPPVMAREIALLKIGGALPPQTDQLDPAKMLFPDGPP